MCGDSEEAEHQETSAEDNATLFSREREEEAAGEVVFTEEEDMMVIDSKDDQWLLEAAMQFNCSDTRAEAAQEKYKVSPLDVDTEAIRRH